MKSLPKWQFIGCITHQGATCCAPAPAPARALTIVCKALGVRLVAQETIGDPGAGPGFQGLPGLVLENWVQSNENGNRHVSIQI
jgi:hypothetical protein